MAAMRHVGTIHAFGWIIMRIKHVAIMQDARMMRNNLILASTGLGVLVFIGVFSFFAI